MLGFVGDAEMACPGLQGRGRLRGGGFEEFAAGAGGGWWWGLEAEAARAAVGGWGLKEGEQRYREVEVDSGFTPRIAVRAGDAERGFGR